MFKVGDMVIMKHFKSNKNYYSIILLDICFSIGTIEKFSERGDSALIRDDLDFGFWVLNENISSIITLCA